MQIERHYRLQLHIEGIEHSDLLSETFLESYDQELCPSHGIITHKDGKIVCSIHNEKNGGEEDGDSMPYI